MAFNDSLTSTTTLDLLGVWVHDPLDSEGTLRQYQFGSAARSRDIDARGEGQFYAGRTYQVRDFGEHQADNLAVTVDVPHGPNWAQQVTELENFATARTTLVLRDNRGRVYFGPMLGYRENDQDWGTQVTFSVARVDYDEGIEVTV